MDKDYESIRAIYSKRSSDYLNGVMDENIQIKDYAQQMIDICFDILSERGEIK